MIECISRQAVFDLVRSLTRWCVRSEDGKLNNVGLLYDDVMFGIYRLPSVTPTITMPRHLSKSDYEKLKEMMSRGAVVLSTERTGHWKSFTHSAYHGIDDDGEPIWREVKVYHCSECNRRTVIKENYCPNCGADMRGDADESNH